MKKVIISILFLVFAGVISAQNVDTKNNNNTVTKTDTVKTVTKSTPVLKKKLVVVSNDKLNTRTSAIQADDQKNNVGRKDPDTEVQEEKTPE